MSTTETGDTTVKPAAGAVEGEFVDRQGNKRKWTRPDNFERISKQEKKRIRKERVAFNKAKRRDKHKSKMKTLRREAREGKVPSEVVPEKRPSRYKLVHVMREVFAKRADYPPPHTVVIDASYNENDPYETRSLAKQLNFIYARNRFHHFPLHTLMTSCVGPVKEAFEFRNGHNWKEVSIPPSSHPLSLSSLSLLSLFVYTWLDDDLHSSTETTKTCRIMDIHLSLLSDIQVLRKRC
eukprot:TRINITY_DN1634_c0_g1_i4.p1 TRINITY_DN1634_c0_g1~~TRINITY_DN1634_c0_g1_i4.p1  ORF type:complete len:237 (+),score=41.61 TRINITY_DN1634_c0_g1_i4:46-756(+)